MNASTVRMAFLSLLFIVSTPSHSEGTRHSEHTETESFLTKLLRISGISATPSTMRGQGSGLPGQIWIAPVGAGEPRRITKEDTFRSPIFLPDGKALLALKSGRLFRVPLTGGEPRPLDNIPDVVKLIGFEKNGSDTYLVATTTELVLVSLNSGNREHLAYLSEISPTMLSYIRGWRRDYGTTRVYVDIENEKDRRGRYQKVGTNVYTRHNETDSNLSRCHKSFCGQPSLSPDGRSVAFIKPK